MEEMLENQREALSLLRGLVGASKTSTDGELLEDVLPNQINTKEQLQEISEKILSDEGSKKKMVVYNLLYNNFILHCTLQNLHQKTFIDYIYYITLHLPLLGKSTVNNRWTQCW